MNLSTFLTNLVIPINLCVTLLLIGVIFYIARWRKAAFLTAAFGLAWALFWSLPASSLWAGGRLEQLYPQIDPALAPASPAIVVLGGSTANGRQNWFEPYDKATAWARVDTAAELYRQDRSPLVVVSGAALEGNVSEAQIMAHSLQEQGVPKEAIALEEASYTTYENAVYTAKLLQDRDIQRILLVTSALHMPRAMAVFQKQGLHPTAFPAPPQITVPADTRFSFWLPNWRALNASRSIVKEYAGLLVYWIRGWI